MGGMKNNMALFLFLCLCIPVVAQDIKTVTVNFSDSDFKLNYDTNNNVIITPTGRTATFREDGISPCLPYVPVNVLIGHDQVYKSLSYSVSNKVKIKSGVVLAQNSLPCPTSEIGNFIEPQVVSYKEITYPETEVECSGVNRMDGYNILGLEVCPFIYDAKNKDLYFVKSFTINVSFDSGSKMRIDRNMQGQGTVMYDVVKNLVENKDELETLYSSASQARKARTNENAANRVEYLLITNRNLADTFQPLVDWKKEKGLTAKLITVEDIKTLYSGSTTQLKIKNCLKEHYENNGLKYALLGGDDTVVPVMECYANAYNAFITDAMPTDLFYACFDNDFEWNANGNDLYGEIDDNIDMTPEIFLSRVPLQSENDAYEFVNKTLDYEQGIYTSRWTNNLLMCGAKIDTAGVVNGKFVSDVQNKSENMYNIYIRDYWDGSRIRFYDTDTDFPDGANYDCNSTNFQEQFSQGYSFIDIMSHGTNTSFLLEGDYFDVNKALSLYDRTPKVITTTACETNAFDKSYEPCMSEVLIRNGSNGVIAYLGCSRRGLGRIGLHFLGASEDYDGAFYKSLFKDSEGSRSFGEAVALAKTSFLSKSKSNTAHRWVLFGLNPIGDPEMPIYTQKPKYFDSVTFSFDEDRLAIDAGVDGCCICVMGSDCKVVSDTKNATFTELGDGEVDITISKPGYMPWRAITYMKYIQNEIIRSRVNHLYRNSVLIGSDVTDSKTYGPVVVEKGGTLRLKSCDAVTVKGDFDVKLGGEFIVEP